MTSRLWILSGFLAGGVVLAVVLTQRGRPDLVQAGGGDGARVEGARSLASALSSGGGTGAASTRSEQVSVPPGIHAAQRQVAPVVAAAQPDFGAAVVASAETAGGTLASAGDRDARQAAVVARGQASGATEAERDAVRLSGANSHRTKPAAYPAEDGLIHGATSTSAVSVPEVAQSRATHHSSPVEAVKRSVSRSERMREGGSDASRSAVADESRKTTPPPAGQGGATTDKRDGPTVPPGDGSEAVAVSDGASAAGPVPAAGGNVPSVPSQAETTPSSGVAPGVGTEPESDNGKTAAEETVPDVLSVAMTVGIASSLTATPNAMVIRQQIPPGWAVERAEPAYESWDARSRTIKWLFTGAGVAGRAVTTVIRREDAAAQSPAGAIVAGVRYRLPDGSFFDVNVPCTVSTPSL